MTNLILPRRRKLITSSFAVGLAAAMPSAAMGHNGGPPLATDAEVSRVVEQAKGAGILAPWGTLPSDPSLAMFMMAKMAAISFPQAAGGIAATTWDPAYKSAGVTLAAGDLQASSSSGSYEGTRSIKFLSTGKAYAEIQIVSSGGGLRIGVANSTQPAGGGGGGNDSFVWVNSGYLVGFGVNLDEAMPTYGAGDVLGIGVDRSAPSLKLYKNGTLVKTYASLPTGDLYIYESSQTYTLLANFGASAFVALPSGYEPWG